jgi:hypothetical protein
VLANDHHAVVLACHSFTRDGESKDYRTAHVYEIRDGQLAESSEHPRDQAIFDDAWASVTVEPVVNAGSQLYAHD